MILIGQSGEDYPSLRISYEAFRPLPFFLLFHLHHRAAMTVFFRICKCIPNHLIGFFRRSRVKYRKLGEQCKKPRILLRLRRNRARVIRRYDYHAALHSNISKAHQRVRRHIQPYLLHSHQRSCSRVGSACGHLKRRFLIYRPFHMDTSVIIFCHRLQNLCRRRSGITGNQIHSRTNRTKSNRLITHQ